MIAGFKVLVYPNYSLIYSVILCTLCACRFVGLTNGTALYPLGWVKYSLSIVSPVKTHIMPILIFILTRLLFIAAMVFIIGYVFGNFSKKPALAKVTKVATLFVLAVFIVMNILFFRWGRPWRYGNFHDSGRFENHCQWVDSLRSQQNPGK